MEKTQCKQRSGERIIVNRLSLPFAAYGRAFFAFGDRCRSNPVNHLQFKFMLKRTQPALVFLITLLVASCAKPAGVAPPDSDLRLLWMVQTNGAINHPPLIVRDLVIVCPSGGPLIALNLVSGSAQWTFAPPEGVWERAYASDGDRVFVGLKENAIAALDASSGKLLWKKDLGINLQVPPLVSEGVVFAPTTFVGSELKPDVHGRAKLFALDARTGEELWVFESDNYILQTPAIHDKTLYLGGNFYDPRPIDEGGHTRLYALDLNDGSPLWQFESEDGFPKRLYATERMVIFIGYQDYLNGVDAKSGELRWRFDTGNWTPSFLGAGDTVYFSSANTLVFALDSGTGKKNWKFNIPEGTFNYLIDAPILLDGRLYFITQQGDLFALEASTGALLWQAKTTISTARTSPAIGKGWLIIGDIEGNVYGYQ